MKTKEGSANKTYLGQWLVKYFIWKCTSIWVLWEKKTMSIQSSLRNEKSVFFSVYKYLGVLFQKKRSITVWILKCSHFLILSSSDNSKTVLIYSRKLIFFFLNEKEYKYHWSHFHKIGAGGWIEVSPEHQNTVSRLLKQLNKETFSVIWISLRLM